MLRALCLVTRFAPKRSSLSMTSDLINVLRIELTHVHIISTHKYTNTPFLHMGPLWFGFMYVDIGHELPCILCFSGSSRCLRDTRRRRRAERQHTGRDFRSRIHRKRSVWLLSCWINIKLSVYCVKVIVLLFVCLRLFMQWQQSVIGLDCCSIWRKDTLILDYVIAEWVICGIVSGRLNFWDLSSEKRNEDVLFIQIFTTTINIYFRNV